MKLAYQFSREEIVSHNLRNFDTFYGIDRLKLVAHGDPKAASELLGSMKLFFELDEVGTQPHEDAEIRRLCGALMEKTPALFLASIDDRTMEILFYSTLANFTAVSFDESPDAIRFDCDREQAQLHFERLQNRILETADELGVQRACSVEHVGWMAVRLLHPRGK